ncbi:metallophosphoesterase [Cyclobacterium jeungdonense]|uniref:Metallophosphoesterase n=1 Tax=Cyclobacterium jeungdonense TaxID=708087 RepID=A0ABT8C493_9BACT|nr:metallophosphoesterase [Cyclobacterium jeungdonense]MDN3687126.1 metallophosphoesterase [Cyclobacterium jeungdonense]
MKKTYFTLLLLSTLWQLPSIHSASFAQSQDIEFAFLSDIHLQDVYAALHSPDFKGVFNPKTGKYATIRSMKSQLNSTRLFNENYFAFIQALEDLKSKGIQLIVLPGDFTDDGQPMNVLALKKILEIYSREYGMRFFLTTGNHDPVKPFGGIGGKKDFLAADGSEQAIAGDADFFPSGEVAVSSQINYWGYEEITYTLSDFGFFPSEQDLFWAHPFQELNVDGYDFHQAVENSRLDQRLYRTLNSERLLPDASYVVEPVAGIWLLALDGNVYTHSGEDWSGSSVGFNQAVKVKKHQLDWINKVVLEAEKRGKTLISFSHYPLVDFHDSASDEMKSLFGEQKFQLPRVPSRETSSEYAKAGIRIHFAGHMHINDTGIFTDAESGKTLVNVQVPSLAAFPPAFKILTIPEPETLEISTIQLQTVDRMDEFFDLYRIEQQWLLEHQDPQRWDSTILHAKNYRDYTQMHLMELTRSRFIPTDWPENLAYALQLLSQKELEHWAGMDAEEGGMFLMEKLNNSKDIEQTDGLQGKLIEDFYLLKNGDELGKKLIPSDRRHFYEALFLKLLQKPLSDSQALDTQLVRFFRIFEKLYHSLPSDHFLIDLQKGEVKRVDRVED